MREEELEVERADTGKSAILEWKCRSGVDYGKETSTLFIEYYCITAYTQDK